MSKLITKLIMFHFKREYKKQQKINGNNTIYYIRGTGKDYPQYLVYTENERVYKKLDNI